MRNHKELEVWKLALGISKDVYVLTRRFPREEIFGLTSQMRRAAVSIASNIAEGASRQSEKEFVNFLHVAAGSASELDTQIEISRAIFDVHADSLAKLQQSVDRAKRMLYGLIRSIKSASAASSRVPQVDSPRK